MPTDAPSRPRPALGGPRPRAPGATRDVLEASLALGAFRVVLADMAGLHEADEAIEAETGQEWQEEEDAHETRAERAAGGEVQLPGVGATMAASRSSSALKRLLFPEFGAPMMAIR